MPALSETLSLITFLGFPLGLYLMGQGILIVFVALLFAFALRQGVLDKTSRP
jgi:putative solute:sodium symporter small subunit